MVGRKEILFKTVNDLGGEFSSSHIDMLRFRSKINRDCITICRNAEKEGNFKLSILSDISLSQISEETVQSLDTELQTFREGFSLGKYLHYLYHGKGGSDWVFQLFFQIETLVLVMIF